MSLPNQFENKIDSFISLQCTAISALSSNDIISMIDAETLQKIKIKDSHPYFQAYSICHEGISTPTVLGDTARPINWLRDAVQSIKKTVVKGVKFFLGHNEDNSTSNREALGEIVADTQQEIDGVLHHIVIGYFPDKNRVQNLDICSQEADWNLFETAGKWFAGNIKKLTGIALSNSSLDAPAFSGAKRLGMVQAFNIGNDDKNNNKQGSIGNMPNDLTVIPFSELVAEVKRRNTFPTQIFTLDEIKKDREIVPFFEKLNVLEKDVTTKEKSLKDLEAEKKSLSKQIESITAKDKLQKILKDGSLIKVTEKQKNFILDNFTSIDDTSDDSFKKLIENKIEERKKFLKSEGISEDDSHNTATTGNTVPPNGGDFTKAANNPLLEEDFEST